MTTRASGDEVLVEKMAKALWNSYGRTAGVPKWGKAPEWKKEMARAGIRAALYALMLITEESGLTYS